MVKLLLGRGADANQALKTPLLRRHNSTSTQSLGEGTTPLLRAAAASGDVAFMRLLLEKGADPKVKQKNGTTMLMLASGFGRRGDHNADALEFEKGTPAELLQAVKVCVEELKLDPNAANDQGDTRPARGAQRGHRALPGREGRAHRREEQARPDAVGHRPLADRPKQPAAAAGNGGGAEGTGRGRHGGRDTKAGCHYRRHFRDQVGMSRSVAAPVAALCLLSLVGGASQARQEPARPSSTAAADVAAHTAVVGKYCLGCHSERVKAGGLALESLDLSRPAANAEVWEKVALKLRGGLMPPGGVPRPPEPARVALVSYLETSLDAAAAAAPNPGRPALHRLNRAEYANAIRDLLSLEVDPAVLLPPDDSSDGFDNNADVLGVSPALLERYLSAARVVASLALGDPKADPTTRVFRAPPDMSQRQHRDGLPLGTIGGLVATHTFPSDGEYVFKVKLMETTLGQVRGLEYVNRVEVQLDGERIHLAEVGGAEDYVGSADNATDVLNNINARLTVRVPVTAGPHAIAAAFLGHSATQGGNRLQFFQRTNVDTTDHTGVPHIESVTLTGPFNAAGAGRTPSRDRILTCRPSSAAQEPACARQIVETLARRAYRRPVTAQEVTAPAHVLQRRPQGRQLRPRHRACAPCRPDEPQVRLPRRAGRADGGIVRDGGRRVVNAFTPAVAAVNDLELASRLSFFLWSSIPDDELVDVAAKGQLRQPAMLERQVPPHAGRSPRRGAGRELRGPVAAATEPAGRDSRPERLSRLRRQPPPGVPPRD